MPQIRTDPITGRTVVIARERELRLRPQLGLESPGDPCPFCSGHEHLTPPELLAYRAEAAPQNSPGWSVRVVPNKYPALAQSPTITPKSERLFRSGPALGSHEVVIESPVHVRRMIDLELAQLAEVARAYQDRLRALRAAATWSYALIYKNEGVAAGATLEHVHSQLAAFAAIPEPAAKEQRRAEEFFNREGRCIYCELLKAELEAGSRVAGESETFVALCPYAPRFPFETWLVPKGHSPGFAELAGPERIDFVSMLRNILSRLDRCLDRPAFNFVLRPGPLDSGPGSHHWRLEIMPRVTGVAGFEWGTGMFINTRTPEHAAREIRNASPPLEQG